MFDVGWLIMFVFMMAEMVLVLLLVAPMPSNQVRGAIVSAVVATWETQATCTLAGTLSSGALKAQDFTVWLCNLEPLQSF